MHVCEWSFIIEDRDAVNTTTETVSNAWQKPSLFKRPLGTQSTILFFFNTEKEKTESEILQEPSTHTHTHTHTHTNIMFSSILPAVLQPASCWGVCCTVLPLAQLQHCRLWGQWVKEKRFLKRKGDGDRLGGPPLPSASLLHELVFAKKGRTHLHL